MPPEKPVTTSIGFGGGDVIEVGLPLTEARDLVQHALRQRVLLELEAADGELMILNPSQIKVLQEVRANA